MEKSGPLQGKGAGEAGTAQLAGLAWGTEEVGRRGGGVVATVRLMFRRSAGARTINRRPLLPPSVALLWILCASRFPKCPSPYLTFASGGR